MILQRLHHLFFSFHSSTLPMEFGGWYLYFFVLFDNTGDPENHCLYSCFSQRIWDVYEKCFWLSTHFSNCLQHFDSPFQFEIHSNCWCLNTYCCYCWNFDFFNALFALFHYSIEKKSKVEFSSTKYFCKDFWGLEGFSRHQHQIRWLSLCSYNKEALFCFTNLCIRKAFTSLKHLTTNLIS